MTNEEKQLILTDLCARLPYGVKCYNSKSNFDFNPINNNFIELSKLISEYEIKSYLRPMSSMTEEERKIYIEISSHLCGEIAAKTMIDWLNKNHFDYRELIPMGLALKATEDMYKED